MSDIIDLGPRLLARKQADCTHTRALVCDTTASLTCDECGAEIDPWWYLRKLANDESILRTNVERYSQLEDQAKVKYEAAVKRMNEHLERLTNEVNHLINERNRLWNLAVPGDGRPLGSVSRRTRRRTVSTGKPTPDT